MTVDEPAAEPRPTPTAETDEDLPEDVIADLRRLSSLRRSAIVMTELLPPFIQQRRVTVTLQDVENAPENVPAVSENRGLYREQTDQPKDGQNEDAECSGSEAEYSDVSSSDQVQEGRSSRSDFDIPGSSDSEKKDPLWWLQPCATRIPSNQGEEEEEYQFEGEEIESVDYDNTTEPFLAHELYIPYEEMPKPRFFYPSGKNVPYVAKSLPKRGRSPVREILPGKFDLQAVCREWCENQELYPENEQLRLSQERMSKTVRESVTQNVDLDTIISSILLQAICEQVSLTIDLDVQMDVRGFVNLGTVLALMEMDNLDIDMLSEEQRRLSFEMRPFYPSENDDFPIPGKIPGYRKILLTVYRSRFSRYFSPTMHHCLPWHYVSSGHHRGQPSCYSTVRERIDEIKPGTEEFSATYVPDVQCPHSRHVYNKSRIAYKRRSMTYDVPNIPMLQDAEDLFMNFATIM